MFLVFLYILFIFFGCTIFMSPHHAHSTMYFPVDLDPYPLLKSLVLLVIPDLATTSLLLWCEG